MLLRQRKRLMQTRSVPYGSVVGIFWPAAAAYGSSSIVLVGRQLRILAGAFLKFASTHVPFTFRLRGSQALRCCGRGFRQKE